MIRGLTQRATTRLIQSAINSGPGGASVLYIPPLDVYTEATRAYGTRKLRTAYTGDCVRVRRSSDDAEQDIGFTELGLLDEVALLAFVGAGDGFVKTWYDQSTVGDNATQATALDQPKIVDSGVVVKSFGRSALLFDGTNSYMNFSSAVPYASSTLTECSLICSPSAFSLSDNCFIAQSNGTNAIFDVDNQVNLRLRNVGLNRNLASNPNAMADGPLAIGFQLNTSDSNFAAYMNGGVTLREPGSQSQNTPILSIGARSNGGAAFNGTISEVIYLSEPASSVIVPLQFNQYNWHSALETSRKSLGNTIWNQWIEPLSVSISGKTYVGGISAGGTIVVDEINESTLSIERAEIASLQEDDHNAPCLLFDDTKDWYCIYTNHGTGRDIFYKKSSTGLNGFGSESSITVADFVTYVQGFRCTDGADTKGRIVLFFRQRPEFAFTYSDDEGSTWAAESGWIGSDNWLYHMTKQIDTQRIAVGVHLHPIEATDQDLYYCEIDLSNGNIENVGASTTLGDLWDGTNLPIDYTDCQLVYEAGVGEATRLYDVWHDTVLAAKWSETDLSDAVVCVYERDGTSFVETELCSAGDIIDSSGDNNYLALGCIRSETEVYVCTNENSGQWKVLKFVKSGGSWSRSTISDREAPNKKMRPNCPKNSSSAIPVVWCEGQYNEYRDYLTNKTWQS